MPIRPENLHRYPTDWKHIRAHIIARARNRCEKCGLKNGTIGGRTSDGVFLPAIPDQHMYGLRWPKPGTTAYCAGAAGNMHERLKIIQIVLTIAHLDHQPENCADDNLLALCQRCHLTYDAKHHAQTRYRTAREPKAIADLFDQS